MPLPPWDLVWPLLHQLVAPALCASVVVMATVRILGGERLAPLAAGLALAAGVVAGNHFRGAIDWQPETGRALTFRDVPTVLAWSLESKPATDIAENSEPAELALLIPYPRFWLPWLASVACLVELFMRLAGVAPYVAGVVRTLIAMLAGRLLTPAMDWRIAMPWVSWCLAMTIVLSWSILETLARQWKDGTVAAALAIWFAAAGVVLLFQADTGKGMDSAMYFSVALLGLALVSWIWPGDTGPAVAAAAVFLPSLLFVGYHDIARETLPPIRSFLLVGLAPVALAPMLLPFFARQGGLKHWVPTMMLALIPAVVAVIWVFQIETIEF